MQKTSGIRGERHIPDYVGDRFWAGQLAKNIEEYWRKRGYHDVRAWVETDISVFGVKTFNVRSNISYDCEDIYSLFK